MTDPAISDRVAALQASLAQPTPEPLEGQETIDLTPRYEQPTLDEDDLP